MIKNAKRNSDTEKQGEIPKKKFKANDKKQNFSKTDGKARGKFKKPFHKKPTPTEKPDWNKLKKEKKELKIKRKKTNKLYDIIVEAKKLYENLRQKELKGGKNERDMLVSKLHGLFAGKEHYAKIVFAHDVARIVQFLFKFGDKRICKEIADELIPVTVEMLQSKYGKNCLKSMLKYGNNQTRSACIRKMYGSAVKLSSHAISSDVFEYAYSTWATPKHKQDLVQEFFGDIYKQAKDPEVKHLRDVYKNSPNMKTASIQSTKANLSRVLNKDLLDSGLIQTVLYQFLSECSSEDKTEMIGQLAPHTVVISNSKDGAKAAMQCIWYGSNKDRKVIMKAIKEHVKDLSKHEHGHCSVIALLDAVDDTVLLNKMILTQLLSDINTLVADEHGRKVLLWLVAPTDSTHFCPSFIKELDEGRQASSSKKPVEQRREELLKHSVFTLTNEVISNTDFWMSNGSIAMVTLAIMKAAPEESLQDALNAVAKCVVDPKWTIKKDKEDLLGIEHPGLHMILKKLAQHDKVLAEAQKPTFSNALLSAISEEAINTWLSLNRGCYLFVFIYENGTEEIQNLLKKKLKKHLKTITPSDSTGAQILLEKLS